MQKNSIIIQMGHGKQISFIFNQISFFVKANY